MLSENINNVTWNQESTKIAFTAKNKWNNMYSKYKSVWDSDSENESSDEGNQVIFFFDLNINKLGQV